MKRDIKFRAWDKDENRYFIDGKDGYLANLLCCNGWDMFSPDDYVWEQFTGLTDANGKEIYTGDILEVTIDSTVQADKYLVKNVWDPHVWTEESDGYYAVSKMKVQGNVHKNPELLEDK